MYLYPSKGKPVFTLFFLWYIILTLSGCGYNEGYNNGYAEGYKKGHDNGFVAGYGAVAIVHLLLYGGAGAIVGCGSVLFLTRVTWSREIELRSRMWKSKRIANSLPVILNKDLHGQVTTLLNYIESLKKEISSEVKLINRKDRARVITDLNAFKERIISIAVCIQKTKNSLNEIKIHSIQTKYKSDSKTEDLKKELNTLEQEIPKAAERLEKFKSHFASYRYREESRSLSSSSTELNYSQYWLDALEELTK